MIKRCMDMVTSPLSIKSTGFNMRDNLLTASFKEMASSEIIKTWNTLANFTVTTKMDKEFKYNIKKRKILSRVRINIL